MKLVTFVTEGAAPRAGVALHDGRILDLAEADAQFEGVSVLDIVARAARLVPRADALAASVDELHPGAFVAERDARLLAPIPRPVSMRDGYAFRQHVETARRNRGLAMIPEFDLFPVFYFTNHLAVIGPGELRVGRGRLERLDFELEAFCVIGKRITNPTIEEADAAIFGYGVMNDWSARALQMEEMKLNLGPAKGKDFATAIGPWLVTKDELSPRMEKSPKGNVIHARMTADVNGVRLSDGNLDQMNWTFAEIVQRAADGVTLEPGEVIGSGTVGTGCLLELNGSKITHDQWIRPGDVVSLAIEGLGTLTNIVVEDATR
jgi:fumarylacetoacetate (FAA) hydrolase